MSTHNICFCGKIRKISTHLGHITSPLHKKQKHFIWSYVLCDQSVLMHRLIWAYGIHISHKDHFTWSCATLIYDLLLPQRRSLLEVKSDVF